ncbi:MAG: MYXO-CTERM sorting domain-containing protein, partial [Polyangiaceae bacterium]
DADPSNDTAQFVTDVDPTMTGTGGGGGMGGEGGAGGGPSTGGGGEGGSGEGGGGANGGSVRIDEGCGCRVPGGSDDEHAAWLWLAAAGLVLSRRRRL